MYNQGAALHAHTPSSPTASRVHAVHPRDGRKIPPGRYIILEDTDSIKVGDLEVKIHVKTEAIKQGIPDEELVDESEEEIEEEVEDIEEDEAEEEEEKVVSKNTEKLALK